MKTNTLCILIVVATYFICTINAQSCSGGNHNNGNDCDESGNKYDYSFDGMPKPSNWRELKEYEYLLEAEGSVPTRGIKNRRQQQHNEQQQESDETPDDFASWEREMAEADNIREETFLESKLGRITLASFAAIAFTFALLRLKKTAGETDDTKVGNNTATKDKKNKKEKDSSVNEQTSKGESKDKKKTKGNKKKNEKENKNKKENSKAKTAAEKVDDKKIKKEVSDEDDEDFVLVTKEETSASKKKKKKKKKKAPKID